MEISDSSCGEGETNDDVIVASKKDCDPRLATSDGRMGDGQIKEGVGLTSMGGCAPETEISDDRLGLGTKIEEDSLLLNMGDMSLLAISDGCFGESRAACTKWGVFCAEHAIQAGGLGCRGVFASGETLLHRLCIRRLCQAGRG